MPALGVLELDASLPLPLLSLPSLSSSAGSGASLMLPSRRRRGLRPLLLFSILGGDGCAGRPGRIAVAEGGEPEKDEEREDERDEEGEAVFGGDGRKDRSRLQMRHSLTVNALRETGTQEAGCQRSWDRSTHPCCPARGRASPRTCRWAGVPVERVRWLIGQEKEAVGAQMMTETSGRVAGGFLCESLVKGLAGYASMLVASAG